MGKLKKGDILDMGFQYAGVASYAEVTVLSVSGKYITVDEIVGETDGGADIYGIFDTTTGRCTNEKSMMGGYRFITPQKAE